MALQTPRLLSALLSALLVAAGAGEALAERADRDRPTLIEGDKCVAEELKQTSVCSGNVVLTRGTLRITGERMEVREDPDGYRHATVTAAAGGLATFRQRQDATRPGVEEVIEGAAERVEYDERSETVRLVQRALWKRLENGQPRDEVAGNLITYDSRASTYSVAGGKEGSSDGRVRLILAPRPEDAPTAPPPAPLKSDPALAAPASAPAKK
jgi:lipopolysaccharide export system protein LptA